MSDAPSPVARRDRRVLGHRRGHRAGARRARHDRRRRRATRGAARRRSSRTAGRPHRRAAAPSATSRDLDALAPRRDRRPRRPRSPRRARLRRRDADAPAGRVPERRRRGRGHDPQLPLPCGDGARGAPLRCSSAARARSCSSRASWGDSATAASPRTAPPSSRSAASPSRPPSTSPAAASRSGSCSPGRSTPRCGSTPARIASAYEGERFAPELVADAIVDALASTARRALRARPQVHRRDEDRRLPGVPRRDGRRAARRRRRRAARRPRVRALRYGEPRVGHRAPGARRRRRGDRRVPPRPARRARASSPTPWSTHVDDVVCAPRLAGVCGSDARLLLGDFSEGDLDNPMAAFSPLPFVLGHEVVADVLDAGPRAGLRAGRPRRARPVARLRGARGSHRAARALDGEHAQCERFLDPGLGAGAARGRLRGRPRCVRDAVRGVRQPAARRPRRRQRRRRGARRPVQRLAARRRAHPSPARRPRARDRRRRTRHDGGRRAATLAPRRARSRSSAATATSATPCVALGAHLAVDHEPRDAALDAICAFCGGEPRTALQGLSMSYPGRRRRRLRHGRHRRDP